jgi:hypothetical protein
MLVRLKADATYVVSGFSLAWYVVSDFSRARDL